MMDLTTLTVPAGEVAEGDYLPGLDNGYVFEPATDEDVPPYYDGTFVIARPESTVAIRFHTANGDEAEVILPDDVPVTVARA